MSDELVAVIDQGSTATKGAVFTLDGKRLKLASIPVERHLDGAEVRHDPKALAHGVEEILQTLLDGHDISAFGIACQRSTCLVWERDGARPLTDALSWQDRSQTGRVEALMAHAELVRERTGLRLTPYYAAPKLAALLEEIPGGAARAESGELVAGTLDAFLVQRLTGSAATEPGTAGRTLLYSLENDRWDEQLLALFDLPKAAMPKIHTSAGPWGEFRGVPLLAVAGDQQASLIGHGGWRLGTTAAHFGTGAFVLASTGERIARHEGLLTAVLASTPETRRFQIEGSVNSAGSAVDWARALTGVDLEAWSDRPIETGGAWVLPSFTGTATPWWQTRSLGVLAGLELSTSPEDIFAAVLAGIAHRILDCVEAVSAAGIDTTVLRVSGKLTRLGGMVQLLADAGQAPVEISAEEETGSLGLVRLVASQIGGDDEALLRAPASRAQIEPAWPAQRAAEVRGQWGDFAAKALELS